MTKASPHLPSQPGGQQGFSLAEVTLALGITAFCLVTIFGLLPVGLNMDQNAVQQTEAANVLSMIAADIQATKTSGTSSAYGIVVASGTTLYLKEDATNVRIPADAKYSATITFGTSSGLTPIPLNILVTWPAQATTANASGRLEAVTLLNRN